MIQNHIDEISEAVIDDHPLVYSVEIRKSDHIILRYYHNRRLKRHKLKSLKSFTNSIDLLEFVENELN